MLKMTVTGKRQGRNKAFQEVEIVKDRKEGIQCLRRELGSIAGQTEQQYLDALAATGVTVTFEEI